MTIVDIISDALTEIGFQAVTQIIGSTDRNIVQCLALANLEGQMLVKNHTFQEMRAETVHTTLAAEAQGAIDTLSAGFDRMLWKTMWDRTNQLKVGGPITPESWQAIKANAVTTPSQMVARLQANQLQFYPAPSAGDTVAWEYMSKQWVEPTTGDNKTKFTLDTDISLVDEELITRGVRWRYLHANGFDYAEAQIEYNKAMKNFGLTNEAREIMMGEEQTLRREAEAIAAV